MNENLRILVESTIFDHFRSLGLPIPSHAEVDLSKAGLSSLQVVDLIFLLEGKLGFNIPDSELTLENFHSIGSIMRMISRLSSGLSVGSHD